MMFGFSERLPLRSLWLGLAVLGGMAALRCETASLTPQPAVVICPEDTTVRAVETPSFDVFRARADRLYRHHHFYAASRAAAGDGTNVVLDVDMKNLAEQYLTLAVSWQVGFDKTRPASDRFFALRKAWRLDTVLGGAFTDELEAATRDNAPKALREFIAAHDDDAAKLAAHTISVMRR